MRDDDQLLNAAETRRLLGDVSDMWIHRRLNDDPTFPRPRYVNHLRFWLRSDLVTWIEQLPRENPESISKGKGTSRRSGATTGKTADKAA
jgi:predicted DNA-binding transcriptional regulator AlpA